MKAASFKRPECGAAPRQLSSLKRTLTCSVSINTTVNSNHPGWIFQAWLAKLLDYFCIEVITRRRPRGRLHAATLGLLWLFQPRTGQKHICQVFLSATLKSNSELSHSRDNSILEPCQVPITLWGPRKRRAHGDPAEPRNLYDVICR